MVIPLTYLPTQARTLFLANKREPDLTCHQEELGHLFPPSSSTGDREGEGVRVLAASP